MARLGETAKGAAGGAATGAAIGSVIPGVGTAIGAGVGALGGGLMGYLGSGNSEDDKQRALLEEYRKQIMGREAPQMGPASLASTSGFRANQQGLIGRLEAMSMGQGPSVVGEQLKQATDQNAARQSSIANSGRGNATLANLVAANNTQNFGQGAAQQAAIGRLGEQQMALQQLGSVTGQARGMDEAGSQFNAQQNNFNSQANLEAKLRAMGLNDQAILATLGQTSQLNGRPTTGDQLLAGGIGALGMWAGQRGGMSGGGGGGAAGYGTPGSTGLIRPY